MFSQSLWKNHIDLMATDGKRRRSAHWSKLGLKLTYIIPQERGLKRLLKLICKR